MMSLPHTDNRRILVIDDNDAIHGDFRKILCVDDDSHNLAGAEQELFGAAGDAQPAARFEVEAASQGAGGLDMAIEARAAGRPFAVAFVDMRMPPGWDGLETIERLWSADADIQTVICTAYSDYSWEQMLARLGASDRLLVLKKPFDAIEVSQMAMALTEKWNLLHYKRDALLAKSERERRSLQSALKAMRLMLGVVGHELRTPLAALRASAEFLLDTELGKAAQMHPFLTAIHDESVRMADMVNNMLEAARLNSGVARWNWGSVQLEAACREAIGVANSLIGQRDVRLFLEMDPPDLTMNGDDGAILRLLINLLSNAAKCTPQGSIRIRGEAVERRGEPWVRLTVADTGEGMSDRVIAKLGQAFALNSGSIGPEYVKGTGLGLTICKAIAAAHGGCITVSSELGMGTTFTVVMRSDLTGSVEIDDRIGIEREEAA